MSPFQAKQLQIWNTISAWLPGCHSPPPDSSLFPKTLADKNRLLCVGCHKSLLPAYQPTSQPACQQALLATTVICTPPFPPLYRYWIHISSSQAVDTDLCLSILFSSSFSAWTYVLVALFVTVVCVFLPLSLSLSLSVLLCFHVPLICPFLPLPPSLLLCFLESLPDFGICQLFFCRTGMYRNHAKDTNNNCNKQLLGDHKVGFMFYGLHLLLYVEQLTLDYIFTPISFVFIWICCF